MCANQVMSGVEELLNLLNPMSQRILPVFSVFSGFTEKLLKEILYRMNFGSKDEISVSLAEIFNLPIYHEIGMKCLKLNDEIIFFIHNNNPHQIDDFKKVVFDVLIAIKSEYTEKQLESEFDVISVIDFDLQLGRLAIQVKNDQIINIGIKIFMRYTTQNYFFDNSETKRVVKLYIREAIPNIEALCLLEKLEQEKLPFATQEVILLYLSVLK